MAHKSRQLRYVRPLLCEQFEARLCLSAVSFASHDIFASEANGVPIIFSAGIGVSAVFATDLDGDSDMDVLSASSTWDATTNTTYYLVAWHENTDGNGVFGPQQVITTEARWANSVHAADVDGDGDMDVLSAGKELAWHENTDGKGSFGPPQVITNNNSTMSSVRAADLDGDGDVDFLSASQLGRVVWHENTDGKGEFGEEQLLGGTGSSVSAIDLDGDGDLDVLAEGSGTIAWHENMDGAGIFGPRQHIDVAAYLPSSFHAADLDGDGDMDVLSASRRDGKVAWYEHIDGTGHFGEQRVITTEAIFPGLVDAADMDGDGDADVLSAGENDIKWYENIDGIGSFGPQQLVATEESAPSLLCVADMDGDGDADVVSGTASPRGFGHGSTVDKVAWYEQYRTTAGDATRDGEFNQRDIVQVLQAAKYVSGEAATWEEGDWNGDEVFDHLDIVAALQTGTYLQGPYAARVVDAVFAGT